MQLRGKTECWAASEEGVTSRLREVILSLCFGKIPPGSNMSSSGVLSKIKRRICYFLRATKFVRRVEVVQRAFL